MKQLYLLTLCCLVLLLSACSKAEGSDTTRRLYIEGNDTLTFTPDSVSVPAQSAILLTFKNVGTLNHNIILTNEDVDLLKVSDADTLNGIRTEILEGGAETSVTFEAPASGDYLYVCVVPGHAASGMVGKLTVTEP